MLYLFAWCNVFERKAWEIGLWIRQTEAHHEKSALEFPGAKIKTRRIEPNRPHFNEAMWSDRFVN